jgi:hypothetical protein
VADLSVEEPFRGVSHFMKEGVDPLAPVSL